MTLGSIKVGDIVHVDKKGRQFYAEVTDKVAKGADPTMPMAHLTILPCCRESYRTAAAQEVIGHYRKAAGSA